VGRPGGLAAVVVRVDPAVAAVVVPAVPVAVAAVSVAVPVAVAAQVVAAVTAVLAVAAAVPARPAVVATGPVAVARWSSRWWRRCPWRRAAGAFGPARWRAPAWPQVQAPEAPGIRQHAGAERRRCAAAKGSGETIIRLPRGASLTIRGQDRRQPAALVQVLFHLGEMVTATQSVSEDILELLGSEMNYVVNVVSPERRTRELLGSFDSPTVPTPVARTTWRPGRRW